MNDEYLRKLLYQRKMFDESDTRAEYMAIINDYGVSDIRVRSLLNKAAQIKRRRPDVDHYSYIVYGLIREGKR